MLKKCALPTSSMRYDGRRLGSNMSSDELNQLCYIKERAKADAARYGLWVELSQRRAERAQSQIDDLKLSMGVMI